eukprot:3390652-Prymnesium_polylepis.1
MALGGEYIRALARYVQSEDAIEQQIMNGGMVVVFCFSSLNADAKTGCVHCIRYAPAVLRYCQQSGMAAYVVLGAQSMHGNYIEGYPSTFLFKFGELHSSFTGNDEQSLQIHTQQLKRKQPGSNRERQGYIYHAHDDRERYVGQTMQKGKHGKNGAQVRMGQEAGVHGHNDKLRAMLNRPDVQREAAQICRMVPGSQQRDCLDYFEERIITMTDAANSSRGGLNRTHGNAGLSQKLGYNYGNCSNLLPIRSSLPCFSSEKKLSHDKELVREQAEAV